MALSNGPFPDLAAAARRVAELEAENLVLQQSLAEAEFRSRHMLDELRRRTRNTFAVMRSIVRRTATTSDTVDDYTMHLTGRLDAVARAEAITLRHSEGGASLHDLLAEELLAHAVQEGDQVSLSGPQLRLQDKAGEVLALAMHELTVNAVKYGALSTPEGRIAVTWHIEPALAKSGEAGRMLRLQWRETGTSLPDVPARPKGFGTQIIERTLV